MQIDANIKQQFRKVDSASHRKDNILCDSVSWQIKGEYCMIISIFTEN
jgi:hypothetical protein